MKINLNAPQDADQAAKVARAQQIRLRADNVLSALQQPDDSFKADAHGSNDRLGAYAFQGKIGPEQFAAADMSVKNGVIESFIARDPANRPGEAVRFHLASAKAQGLRASIAGGFGGVGGAMANAASFLVSKAISNYPQHKIASRALELASQPFAGLANLARHTEQKLAYTSAKDHCYGLSSVDGSHEQVRFHNDNTLEYEIFARRP
ncbi:hypothetical protein ABS71_12120 [bacterium SCN 62-11]|nr:MAG: hypothetical protein ABS71_12120 [bacterium SCN 62-11]